MSGPSRSRPRRGSTWASSTSMAAWAGGSAASGSRSKASAPGCGSAGRRDQRRGCGGSRRARASLRRLAEVWPLPAVRVELLETIPAHSGLGSGTQLGLALGVGLARLLAARRGRPCDRAAPRARRQIRHRVGAFLTGGFLVDGGRGAADEPPPIISRLAFPETWRLLLMLDENGGGSRARSSERLSAPPTLPGGGRGRPMPAYGHAPAAGGRRG